MTVDVSVVVLTVAGLPQLRSCLAHLAASDADPREIIVVDASPGGQLAQVLAVEFPRVGVVRNSAGVRARRASRRIGTQAARGVVVAFLDDDAEVAPDWLTELWRPYSESAVVGVGGRLEARSPGGGGQLTGLVGRLLPNGRLTTHFWVDPGRDVEVDHLSGVNMSFRRQPLLDHGVAGPEHGGTGRWEDADTSIRVKRAGGRLVFNPRAVVRYDPQRPRTGGRAPGRPGRHFSSVRNNLEMLIGLYGLRARAPWSFTYSVLRDQAGHLHVLRHAVRSHKGHPKRAIADITEQFGCVVADIAGLAVGLPSGVVRHRAGRR